MPEFGLIGKALGHSFSPEYFTEKFRKLGLDYTYAKFELAHIKELNTLTAKHPELIGLNVTIPYKEAVIPFLDELSPEARSVKAVNTILFSNGKRIGHNTDVLGFEAMWRDLNLRREPTLVLGTGGASKAVEYVLCKRKVPYTLVSRKPGNGMLAYEDITVDRLTGFHTIVNTTPLGMYPNVNVKPDLPYRGITEGHMLIDLVYQPRVTSFLKEGLERGARTKNGFQMLKEQAEAAWKIWSAWW